LVTVSEIETNPSNFTDWIALHRLLTESYAFTIGRINPPSFLTHMSPADLAAKARGEDLFLIRQNAAPIACMFGHEAEGTYEVGKLAVSAPQQKQNLGRAMIDTAANLAASRGCRHIQLYARVALTENHHAYQRMGFAIVGEFTHPGFNRPTAVVMRRAV